MAAVVEREEEVRCIRLTLIPDRDHDEEALALVIADPERTRYYGAYTDPGTPLCIDYTACPSRFDWCLCTCVRHFRDMAKSGAIGRFKIESFDLSLHHPDWIRAYGVTAVEEPRG